VCDFRVTACSGVGDLLLLYGKGGVSLETSVLVEKEDVVVPNTVVDDNGKLPE
jgi:hypothetical protein